MSNIRVTEGSGFSELRADLRFETHWVWGAEPFPLWYRYPAEYRECLRPENGDPFLAVGLAPAMLLGETLEIPVPVSRRLLEAVPQIQTILQCWEPKLQRIEVRATPRGADLPGANGQAGRGLFFSLGVDSSYSLCKDLQKPAGDDQALTHLVSVLGFDVYLWEQERYGPIRERVDQVARTARKQVLSVATNLRDVSDRLVDWPLIYHGAALASVALALQPAFRAMTIAATGTYAELHTCGTHPLLDPLWSTEQVTFVHDGCEADRLEKIRALARFPWLLATLRVCVSDDEPAAYNCGRCEKCLRTMVGLQVAGVLEGCPAFPAGLDLARLRKLEIKYRAQLAQWQALREALGDSARDREIKQAIEELLAHARPQH